MPDVPLSNDDGKRAVEESSDGPALLLVAHDVYVGGGTDSEGERESERPKGARWLPAHVDTSTHDYVSAEQKENDVGLREEVFSISSLVAPQEHQCRRVLCKAVIREATEEVESRN